MAVTYRLKHVGINCENEAEAKKLVSLLCHLFNMETGHENDTHTFVSTAFEVMKHNQIGTHGHIALQTDDVEAAMKDLASKGITFKENTIRRMKKERLPLSTLMVILQVFLPSDGLSHPPLILGPSETLLYTQL